MTRLIAFGWLLFVLCGCGISKQLNQSAHRKVLQHPALQTAHVGISIYDAEAGRYLYNYQGDKYFVPASNAKIPTCYAAMKYLGDSLVGLRYYKDDGYILQATGDPTFLHPEFKKQPVFDFLKSVTTSSEVNFCIGNWQEQHLGSGWAWNDYSAAYMAERSGFPVYGNVVRVYRQENNFQTSPALFKNQMVPVPGIKSLDSVEVERDVNSNTIFLKAAQTGFSSLAIPIKNNGFETTLHLLNDTLQPRLAIGTLQSDCPKTYLAIHSQPTDSLLKPMMHRSDNFFAEQCLLMVSNERLGLMNDAQIIDTILKTDFADLPQKPRWADGSGLSRYNLFTPQDFVAILNKMRLQFGMNRLKEILATGNEGTLSNYYKNSSGSIFAKTGTLSGVVALSGFLYSRKNKLLIFSVLVNNHQATATAVRRAVEHFIEDIRNEY